MAGNPINSHVRPCRSTARIEISSVDFVQCLVLCRIRFESSFTRRYRNVIGVRKTSKNLKMQNTIYRTARTLKRFLKRIHSSSDVLLKRVGYKDAILFRVATIGTDPREVVDSIMYLVAPTRSITSRAG